MTFKWTRIDTVELQNDKKKIVWFPIFFFKEDLVDLVHKTDLTDYESDRSSSCIKYLLIEWLIVNQTHPVLDFNSVILWFNSNQTDLVLEFTSLIQWFSHSD